MKRSRIILTGTAAAVGLGIALAPVTAQAATPAAVSAASQSAPSPVASIEQEVIDGYALVTVDVTDSTTLILRDASGAVVDHQDAYPGMPAVFVLEGTGAPVESYSFVRLDGSVVESFSVRFEGAELAAPVVTTNHQELQQIQRAVQQGRLDHVLSVRGVPGATVTLVVNGVTTSAVAGSDGITAVPVRFHLGANDVRSTQSLDGVRSAEAGSSYAF